LRNCRRRRKGNVRSQIPQPRLQLAIARESIRREISHTYPPARVAIAQIR
jgi:hypothetical protein